MSNTICKYPFTSIAIKDYRKDGKLHSFWPCCSMGNATLDEVKNYSGRTTNRLNVLEDVSELTPEEIFNHPAMDRLRDNLSNGVRDKACTVCWEQEDRGIMSFRQFANSDMSLDEITKDKKLRMIDMSINNQCNLRCRMCSPALSNLLMVDYKYFEENNLLDDVRNSAERWSPSHYGAFKLSDVKQWQWIVNNTDKFEILRISGGEPFYNTTVLEFLDKAIADGTSQNITLEFHTNATLFDEQLVKKLSHFKNRLNFSIDGSGKPYELTRYPATWQQLDNSVRYYIENIKQDFYHFAHVVTAINVFNIPDYVAWIDSLNVDTAVSYAEVHSQNRGISLVNMPVELLEQAYVEIEQAGKMHPKVHVHNALNIIRDAIKNNIGDKKKTLTELELFDKARGQNFRDYVDPRVVTWLDN